MRENEDTTANNCGFFSCSHYAHIFSKKAKKIEFLKILYSLKNPIIARIFEFFKKYKNSKKLVRQNCTLNHSDTSLLILLHLSHIQKVYAHILLIF